MIIKNHTSVQKKERFTTFLKWGVVPLLIIGLAAILITQPFTDKNTIRTVSEDELTLIADAELIEGDYYVLDSFRVGGVNNQTADFAFQGTHSVMVKAPDNKYCFGYSIFWGYGR